MKPGWAFLVAVGVVGRSPGGRCRGRRGEVLPVTETLMGARS